MNQSDRKTESRRRILEAAREVFFREDYMGANIDEIASKAGLSKGSVYRHFESKAGLYVSVLGENGKIFLDALAQRIEASSALHSAERIRDMYAFYLEHWMEFPDHFRIFWAIDNEPVIGEIPGDLADRIPQFWKASLELSQTVIDEGVRRGELIECDTWEAAQTCWTLATALIEHDGTPGRRRIRARPLQSLYETSIEIFVRGLLVDSSHSRLPSAPDAS